jgi:4'-phosphopantetheinyl transferase
VNDPSSTRGLAAGEVHLWVVFQDEASDPALLDRYRTLLTGEELAKVARFHFEKHRTQCLVTRALIRTVLSGYTGVDPRAWRFAAGEYGRPEIASPKKFRTLSFNIAHTDGLIVCACTSSGRVGVDAEHVRADKAPLNIADSYFSAAEVAELNAQPLAARHERFFYYWTLKESYIKAIGTGLSTPLNKFSFGIGGNGELRLSFDGLPDDPANWRCWLIKPDAGHVVAVCSERSQSQRMVAYRAVPLASAEPLRYELMSQSAD